MKKLKDPYPSLETWQFRQEYFSYLMGQALGDEFASVSNKHARVLELELETVFCSGAWYSTIVIAYAIAEVVVHGLGEKNEAKFLLKYGLRDDWIWLINKRKYIAHCSQHSPKDTDMVNYEQPELEAEAQRAVGIALKIQLLGTREQLPDSIPLNRDS